MENKEKSDKAKEFYGQTSDIAIVGRLKRLQEKEDHNQILPAEVDLLWNSVQECYTRKDWEHLIAFREALQPLFDLNGYWDKSLVLNVWVDEAAKALDDTFNEARWTHDRADILNQQGKYNEAEQLYQRSEELYRSLNKDEWALKSRHMRSMVVRAQGNSTNAQQLCQSIIVEATKLSLGSWIAHPLYVMALLVRDQGNTQRAEALMKESLLLLEETDEVAMKSQCCYFLGELALHQKKLAQARAYLNTSLDLAKSANVIRRVMATQRLLGDLALAEASYEEASLIYSQVMEMFTEEGLNDLPALAQTYFSRARLMIRLKKLSEAVTSLKSSVAVFRQIGNMRRVAGSSFLLMKVYIQQGQLWEAGKLVVPTLRALHSAELFDPRKLLALLRRQPM